VVVVVVAYKLEVSRHEILRRLAAAERRRRHPPGASVGMKTAQEEEEEEAGHDCGPSVVVVDPSE